MSPIFKKAENNGRTLTLDDVRREEGWQTDAEGGFLRYSATATYVGTTSNRYATGYTVTANYTGEVSRSDVEMVTWRVEFAPVREAEPVTAPPQPEPEKTADSTDPEDGGETAVVESPLSPERCRIPVQCSRPLNRTPRECKIPSGTATEIKVSFSYDILI